MTNAILSRLHFPMFAAIFAAVSAVAADPVVIVTQPKDRRVTDQAAVTLTVKADGTEPVTYQWFLNGSAIGGATHDKLELPKVTFADSGAKFHVVVKNEVDGKPASVTSTNVTLTVVTPASALTHRYSFAKDASDSVGSANGTLEGAAAITNGKVVLDGQRGTFVNLPGGLIAGNTAVTFEFWADLGVNRNWARVFDQGSTNGNNGGHDLYFSPRRGQTYGITIMDPHPRERVITARGNLDNSTNLHVACVLDPGSGFMGFYTNGVLVASTNGLTSFASVDTNWFFLGKSLFGGDPALNGSIDEFRVYNVGLSADAVAASYKAGPNAEIKK